MAFNRFEHLPEEILLHILSFLPTVFAVRTCVLSKRWKSVWKDVPNLILEELSEKLSDAELSVTRFENFVDRVLQHHNSPTINKFSVSSCYYLDPCHISKWIDYAVSHSVRELSLDVTFGDGDGDDCKFLNSLFTCDSVVKFSLYAPAAFWLPSIVRFSNLKILNLKWVTFSDKHLTNQLFPNCPVLEELILNDCYWHDDLVHISCPRLARLVINQDPDYEIGRKCQLVIYGSCLKLFDYKGECQIECCLVNSVLLVEAYIDVLQVQEEIRTEVADRVHKLLQGLYNVKYLAISSQTLQILNFKEESFSQMPLFQNLTHLRVCNDPVDIQLHSGLLNFLGVCPSIDHLESAEVRRAEGMFLGVDSPNRTYNLELPPFPECLWTTLTTLTIHRFDGRMNEIYAVRSWLMFGRALKSLCVNFLGGQEELEKLVGLLRDFPLSSLVRLCLHDPQCTSGSEAEKLELGPFSVKFNAH